MLWMGRGGEEGGQRSVRPEMSLSCPPRCAACSVAGEEEGGCHDHVFCRGDQLVVGSYSFEGSPRAQPLQVISVFWNEGRRWKRLFIVNRLAVERISSPEAHGDSGAEQNGERMSFFPRGEKRPQSTVLFMR